MDPGRFDPTYFAELLKHMDKQNEILMEAYRSMLHESQKLQSDGNSNAVDNVGALTDNNNNKAVAHPSSIET
ncbi:hypothetical protein AHAS_Ahas09G0083500 [Arachis hypogaea]